MNLVMGVYGPGEPLELATRFAIGLKFPTMTIDADTVGLGMPSDLRLILHMQVKTDDTLLGSRVVEYLHSQKCNFLTILFCVEPTVEIRKILERTCQHAKDRLDDSDCYTFAVRDFVRRREICHTSQFANLVVSHMLNWAQNHRVISRVTQIDIQDGAKIFEKPMAMDFDGFLVVTIW